MPTGKNMHSQHLGADKSNPSALEINVAWTIPEIVNFAFIEKHMHFFRSWSHMHDF